ncbi:MAG: hypothetical protein JWP52_306, partial [Rhizobacter sp.]|nr:hypothetical protein [Rhizobacter sp.]
GVGFERPSPELGQALSLARKVAFVQAALLGEHVVDDSFEVARGHALLTE